MSSNGVESVARVRRAFDRRASLYPEHDAVIRACGERLLERIPLLAMSPEKILDIGSGAGWMLATLRKHYPKARLAGVDVSPQMLTQSARPWWRRRRPALVAGDAHTLPFMDNSFNMVLSNMVLPWCHDPLRVLSEVKRVLKPGGVVLLTSAGPDTLLEYRQLWQWERPEQRAWGLLDMHDLGDIMLAAGLAEPVMDRDNLNIDYPDLANCERELQALGVINLSTYRRRGLMSPAIRQELRRRAGQQRFQVTLELVQGHAWKSDQESNISQSRSDRHGNAVVSLDSLRHSLRK